MEIKLSDLEKWKENTLITAKNMRFDKNILNYLENTKLNILNGDSGKLFYGWAIYNPSENFPIIEVYQSNPSKYLPKKLKEIWNQSGMDHELLGHHYGRIKDNDGFENYARKTQIKVANFRGKDSNLWKLASKTLPILFNLKTQ
ncbi:hypothetical protein GW932_00870 [archaeon]|nr:hypothetical protein [archaeon]